MAKVIPHWADELNLVTLISILLNIFSVILESRMYSPVLKTLKRESVVGCALLRISPNS